MNLTRKKIQPTKSPPSEGDVKKWLSGLAASTDETLLPEYSSDKSRAGLQTIQIFHKDLLLLQSVKTRWGNLN